jgi:acetate CoA-transferase
LYGGAPVNRFISGDFVLDDSQQTALPLNQRKLVARRALFEMRKGAVGNVGVGIADGIGLVAREEGCADDFILTVETGRSAVSPLKASLSVPTSTLAPFWI